MKAYILKIVGAALLAAFSEYLVPQGWRKYVKLVSGLIIISVLISPFGRRVDFSDFEEIGGGEEYAAEGESLMRESVRDELEKAVETDIERRAEEEFSQKVKADVRVRTDGEGKIERVEKIKLFGREREEITERLKFVYGTEEVVWSD